MPKRELINEETYDPNRLLDAVIEKLNLKNDAALCRMLGISPPVVSKIRHRRLPVGASLLIRLHELTDWNVLALRDLMGDRRQKLRLLEKKDLRKANKA